METQEEQKPEPRPQWAVVELMGHVRTGGRIDKDTQLGTAMLRLDVPKGDTYVTQLVNPSSIYRITFCDEAIARVAAKASEPMPIREWELERASLPEKGSTTVDEGYDPEDL